MDATLAQRTADALNRLGASLTDGPGVTARTPITGEAIGTVPASTAERRRARDRRGAHRFPAWRTVPAPRRGAVVRRLGELLTEHKADARDLVTLEAGKITSEALGEVQEMIDICEFAVGLSRQLYGRTIASERPGHRLMETWHPLGVVGVISAFNFPVAVWSWNTALALVCGDTVVWKPSEATPLTALACATLIEHAAADVGAPREVSRVVQGDARSGNASSTTPASRCSAPPGRCGWAAQVGPRVAAAVRPLLLELGGNNAAIVTPSADLDLAVRGIVFSAAGTAGQRCTTLRRVIAHSLGRRRSRRADRVGLRTVADRQPVRRRRARRPADPREAFDAMQTALDKARADGGVVVGGGASTCSARIPTTCNRRWFGCRRRPRSCTTRRSRRSSTCSPTTTSTTRSRCTTMCRRAFRRRSSPPTCARRSGSWPRRLGLRYRQRQHRHLGRRDRRGVRRREGDRRRPRVRLRRVEGLHAPGHQHGQLLVGTAAGPRRSVRLTALNCGG